MIVLIFVFSSLDFHLLLKVHECRWCTQAKKVLSSLRLELTAQGAALRCSPPSVIPLSDPGAPSIVSVKMCYKRYSDQRTLTIGGSITVRLVSSLTGLDSTEQENQL